MTDGLDDRKDLKDHTPIFEEDYSSLVDSLASFVEIAKTLNQEKRFAESREKLLSIEESLVDFDRVCLSCLLFACLPFLSLTFGFDWF